MTGPVVVLDLAAGQARVADAVVPVSAEPDGGLRYGSIALRPLSFGERWRVVAEDPRELGRAVLAGAAAPTRPIADVVAEVLALHLAGARPDRPVPGFSAQVAALVAAGWTPGDVLAAPADLVDLLTSELAAAQRGGSSAGAGDDPGWTRIVLGPAPALERAEGLDVTGALQLLEADLRGRGVHANTAAARESGAAAAPTPTLTDISVPVHGDIPGTGPIPAAGAPGRPDDVLQDPPGPVRHSPQSPRARRSAPAAAAQHPAESNLEPAGLGQAPLPLELRPIPLSRRSPTAGQPTAPSLPDTAVPAPTGQLSGPARVTPAVPADPAHSLLPLWPEAPRGSSIAPPVPIRSSWLADASPRSTPVASLAPHWATGEQPTHPTGTAELSDRIAALLDEESDLRGLLR